MSGFGAGSGFGGFGSSNQPQQQQSTGFGAGTGTGTGFGTTGATGGFILYSWFIFCFSLPQICAARCDRVAIFSSGGSTGSRYLHSTKRKRK